MEVEVDRNGSGRYLAEDGQFVVRKKSVRLVHEKVAANELLEAPILAGHEPIRPLALCTHIHTQLHPLHISHKPLSFWPPANGQRPPNISCNKCNSIYLRSTRTLVILTRIYTSNSNSNTSNGQQIELQASMHAWMGE